MGRSYWSTAVEKIQECLNGNTRHVYVQCRSEKHLESLEETVREVLETRYRNVKNLYCERSETRWKGRFCLVLTNSNIPDDSQERSNEIQKEIDSLHGERISEGLKDYVKKSFQSVELGEKLEDEIPCFNKPIAEGIYKFALNLLKFSKNTGLRVRFVYVSGTKYFIVIEDERNKFQRFSKREVRKELNQLLEEA